MKSRKMCGIAGRVNFLSGASVDEALIQRMCDLLAPRGPDGAHSYVDAPVGLGHRRLAIIDLSPGTRQPMASENRHLRPEAVRAYLDEHVRGQGHWHYLLWNLLMLELWHRTFIDGDGRLAQARRDCARAVKR